MVVEVYFVGDNLDASGGACLCTGSDKSYCADCTVQNFVAVAAR